MGPSRILIVEDEMIVSKEISMRLQALGYEPTGRAITGEQALAMAEMQRPDLVLMDIRLIGDMDGIDAAKEIRRRFGIPVIFLTAHSEDETLERAKLADPYGYILKPFDGRDLKSSIEMAFHKHQAEVEIQRLNRLYDVLSQVNQTILRVESREELFPEVCRLVVERGEMDLAWIGRVNASTSRIDPLAQFGKRGDLLKEAAFYADDRPEGLGNPGKAIREGKPFVCNQCGNGDCLYPGGMTPSKFGFRSCGSFPLRFHGRVWGSLNICVSRPGFFREREIDLLREVALDISFALDKIEGDARRKQAEATTVRQNRVLSGINSIFREALRSPTENHLGEVCLAVAKEVTGSRSGFLGKNDAQGRFSDVAVSVLGKEVCNMDDPARHHKPLTDLEVHGIYGRVMKDGKGFYTNDPVSHPDSIELPLGHPPLEAFLGAPLKRDAQTVGMIALGNRKGGYSPEELEALEALTPAVVEAFSRKSSETALSQSRAEFQAIFNSISDAIVFTNTNREVVRVNPAFSAMFGYEAEEMMGRTTEILYPDRRGYEEQGRKNYQPGETVDGSPFAATYRRKDGSLFPAESLGVQVKDSQGWTIGLLGVHRDITDRVRATEEQERLEARLRHAQKLEAIGTLAGGIAHDFNNILAPIIGYTEMVLDHIPASTPSRFDLEQVLTAADRARELVRQILSFSRLGEEEPMCPLDMSLIVKEVMKLLYASLPRSIQFKQNIHKVIALAHPTQIHQVVVNLCTNAAHAMGDTGILDVSLLEVSLSAHDLAALSIADLKPGKYARLSVADTGQGMDSETMNRIFDPYFTTKASGKGTGLGLAVVHGIVKSHDGEIRVQSRLGQGSVFEVYIPATTGELTCARTSREPMPRASDRILFVDDEKPIADLGVRMLEQQGYKVKATTSAVAALDLFRSSPDEFDLVVTDYMMPHMTGIDLALEILKVRPDMKIILCTGYHEKVTAETIMEMGIQMLVLKPLDRNELIRIVRSVFEEDRA